MSVIAAPRVGVGVLVVEDGRLLLGQRLGAHGAGSWALPGGHLEFGESVEACARREVLEETGLQIDDILPGPCTNDVFETEGRHYVTLFVTARRVGGQLQTLEPDKCAGWDWFPWAALPDPLFTPLASLRAQGFRLPLSGRSAELVSLLQTLQHLEAELHHPGVRCSTERLEQLLHPDFHEVGRSGRPYDRETVIRYLATRTVIPEVEADNYSVEPLADDCALLTYRSAQRAADGSTHDRALRSSVWRRTAVGWQLCYHQGTPAAAAGP